MTVVVDASVVIKWLLQDPENEAGTDKATRLMQFTVEGEQPVLRPIHWLVEVGAVLARESSETAAADTIMLTALELPTTGDPQILRHGIELAIELKQPVFDTLYHAVALESPDTILISADERYLRAARSKGRIMDLVDWE